MAERYEQQFTDLCDQIAHHNPALIARFSAIHDAFGPQAAYYAAFIIVCLHARVESQGTRVLESLTHSELRGFTYFEFVNEDPRAVRMMDEALTAYQQGLAAGAAD